MCATCMSDVCRGQKREYDAMWAEELNPGLLEEHYSLLTAEPFLQPGDKI